MDSARSQTDQQLSAVRREMSSDYDSLAESMSAHLSEYLSDHVGEDGLVTEDAFRGGGWERMRNSLAREAVDTNATAMRSLGRGLDDVRSLTSQGSPSSSPMPHPSVSIPRDLAWNRRQVESAARHAVGKTPAQGGEYMRTVADRNLNGAVRTARTSINGAENAGRMDAMLARGGSKRWLTVQDERVRDSHAALHGMVVPVGERFPNGLMFPCDPDGDPSEVCNCRCMIEWVDTSDSQPEELPQEWEMAEGQDILGTWQRRPDEYDFEIEDVMNAQGFDGKPRTVDADEFDRAVRQANGGDGLIMQRTYSAPDKETLDMYRQQLYDGKWYVDCSTGGAEYGQGMYCAGDWSKTLSDRTTVSMRHYASLYDGPSYIETMTLDSSARVVKTTDLAREAAKARSSIVDSIADEVVGENLDAAGMGEMRGAERDYLIDLAAGKRPSANISPERYGMSMEDMDEFGEYLRFLTDERASSDAMIIRLEGMDEGVLATALGYDAIDVSGQGYIVVLNRTKLIIRRPE